MKACPFCAETVQDAAVKCRHCGEFFDGRRSPGEASRPWYFRDATVISALLLVTVLALPLVWFSPHYSRGRKVVVTVLVVAVTWLVGVALSAAMKQLQAYYQFLS